MVLLNRAKKSNASVVYHNIQGAKLSAAFFDQVVGERRVGQAADESVDLIRAAVDIFYDP
jgi:hypothetical protein